MTERDVEDVRKGLPLGSIGVGYEDMPIHSAGRAIAPFFHGDAWVAWLDVLGFKDYLGRHSLGTAVQAIQELDGVVDHEIGGLNHAYSAAFHPGTPGPPASGPLHIVRFADTLLLYTSDFTGPGFNRLVRGTAGILGNLMGRELPARAAVAGGEVYLDPAAMFFTGPPILEAHRWSEEQDWAGGILTPTLEKSPLVADAIVRLQAMDFLRAYRVPMKGGEVREFLALNWTRSAAANGRLLYVLWSGDMQGRDGIRSWEAMRKADATAAFLRWIQENPVPRGGGLRPLESHANASRQQGHHDGLPGRDDRSR